MWRCNRNKYNTNIEQNIVRISEREHDAFNRYFKDKQNPREQLLKVFNLVKPVLSNWVRHELEVILNCDDELFYIPELLKHGKKWKERVERQGLSVQDMTSDKEL